MADVILVQFTTDLGEYTTVPILKQDKEAIENIALLVGESLVKTGNIVKIEIIDEFGIAIRTINIETNIQAWIDFFGGTTSTS